MSEYKREAKWTLKNRFHLLIDTTWFEGSQSSSDLFFDNSCVFSENTSHWTVSFSGEKGRGRWMYLKVKTGWRIRVILTSPVPLSLSSQIVSSFTYTTLIHRTLHPLPDIFIDRRPVVQIRSGYLLRCVGVDYTSDLYFMKRPILSTEKPIFFYIKYNLFKNIISHL